MRHQKRSEMLLLLLLLLKREDKHTYTAHVFLMLLRYLHKWLCLTNKMAYLHLSSFVVI